MPGILRCQSGWVETKCVICVRSKSRMTTRSAALNFLAQSIDGLVDTSWHVEWKSEQSWRQFGVMDGVIVPVFVITDGRAARDWRWLPAGRGRCYAASWPMRRSPGR